MTDAEKNDAPYISKIKVDGTDYQLKDAGAYQKPADGIPASDIASGVIPTVPTNISAFTNDAGYITASSVPKELPSYTQADSAKVLRVNTAGTGLEWHENSGGGGTSDYTELSNKPLIGGVVLGGDKSLSAFGAESTSNKTTSITNSPTDTKYPTEKAVKDYVDTAIGNINTILDRINGEVI